MSDAPSRREQLKEERRRQILEAALRVFGEKGFHTANVSDVAAEAGVSQGTIYWYFDSKDELFEAALLSVFDQFGSETAEALDRFETASDKLRALATAMESFADVAESLFMMFLAYWTSSPRREEAGRWWIDLLVEYKDVLVGIVEEGVRRGEFRPVDAESLVWALMAAYDGLAAYLMLMPDLDLSRISQALVETLLQGLLQEGSGQADV
jgi:AcrR family transcriptional regulator